MLLLIAYHEADPATAPTGDSTGQAFEKVVIGGRNAPRLFPSFIFVTSS